MHPRLAGDDLYTIGGKKMKRFCLVLLTVALTLSMLFVVAAASSILYISKQPMDQFVKPGNTATFEVVAVGDGLSYQWQYAMPGFTNFGNCWQGDLGSVYTLPTVQDKNDGMQIRCVVADSSGKTVTSRIVHVYVGKNALTLYGSQGLSFVLEWVSSVCKAVFSPDGALNPLFCVLAIGIALTALLLGVKVIRAFSWGV